MEIQKKYRAVNKIIALFIIICNLVIGELLPSVNVKSIWVNKETLIDTASVDSMLSFVRENQYDKIYLQIRARGDALYFSNFVPRYENLDSLFDPLNYVIEELKYQDIEVHAWFNTYILWSSNNLPVDQNHFYYKCPDCFATDVNGKSDKNIKLNQNHSQAWEGVYLSPLNYMVNEHLFTVIDDLISSYPIDGLHLDYVRFQDIFYGYNKEGINNFINKYNFNPKDISRGVISTRFGYLESEVDSLTNLWDEYRRNSITQFIRSINQLIKVYNENIELSVAVKPNIVEAKYRWYQDWQKWIEEGIIDKAVIMNYESDINKFNLNNNLITYRFSESDLSKIIIGISTFNQDAFLASDKILLSRLNGFQQFSIYNYNKNKDISNWYEPINKILNFKLKE